MNLAHFLLNSRGVRNLALRANTLLNRFGWTPAKMEKSLNSLIEMSQKFGLKLSLPVTAIILERYPKIIQKLQDDGIELAVHGYVHTDYAQLSKEEQLEHFNRAIKVFKKQGIRFQGFRAPYTRWNEGTMLAVQELGFFWESSKTVLWDLLNENEMTLPEKNWKAYKKVLNLYNPTDAGTNLVLPEIRDRFVEIPVTLPDDEMMLDRLRLSPKDIKEVWKKILILTYNRGELFTLQIHPERFQLLREAVDGVLEVAKDYTPGIWLAGLSEIAQWWIERSEFSAKVHRTNNESYKILLNCSHRATILLGQSTVNSRKLTAARELQIQSKFPPVIGIGNDCSQELLKFLKREGYIMEEGKKENYGIYFEGVQDFNEFEILEQIEEKEFPLIRFWRWPYGMKSCLSITGDIDALTLFDFFIRPFGK